MAVRVDTYIDPMADPLVQLLGAPVGMIEEKACHAGRTYYCAYNLMGYRTGYIVIEPGHPWHSVEYDELDKQVSVHGGLSFSGQCTDGTWIIGFDCGHLDIDLIDPAVSHYDQELIDMIHQTGQELFPGTEKTVKDLAFVRKECIGLIAQCNGAYPDLVSLPPAENADGPS